MFSIAANFCCLQNVSLVSQALGRRGGTLWQSGVGEAIVRLRRPQLDTCSERRGLPNVAGVRKDELHDRIQQNHIWIACTCISPLLETLY